MTTPDPPAPTPEPMPFPRPHRRWLRLSLRASMVLVLLVGGLAGWAAHAIRSQREAIAAIQADGGRVVFEYQAEQIGTAANGRPVYRTEPAAPRWLRRVLGDELFRAVRSVYFDKELKSPEAIAAVARFGRVEILSFRGPIGDPTWLRPLRDMAHIGTLNVAASTLTLQALARHHPDLEALSLERCGVTDADLAAIEGLTNLERLGLQGNPQITDAGLAHLRPLRRLNHLMVNLRRVSDEGVRHLGGLTRLQNLHLDASQVTDAGLAHLAPLADLKYLGLSATRVTDAGMPAVARLSNLEEVGLSRLPGLTDAGLVPLRALTKLKKLDVSGSGVTPAGAAALQAALPALRQVINRPVPPPAASPAPPAAR